MSSMQRRSFLKAIGASGVAAAAVACAPAATPAPPPAPQPRRGGTVTYAAAADAITLDPTNVADAVGANSAAMLFEGLVRQDASLAYVPSLATSWESSGLTWTFKLRQGVRFHDGSAFDASSVKFVFDRIQGPERTLVTGTWTPLLDKVEVVDAFTVRFTTKYVDPLFYTRVSGGSQTSIFSAEAFKKFGKDMARNPVGTGPFKFVQWVKDDNITLERFDGYWGGAPFLDRVVVRPRPETESRVIGLESGDIQLAIRLNPEHIERVEKNSRLKLIRNDTQRHYYTGLNLQKKPYSDLRVRQALNHAIDKDSLIKNTLVGLGKPQGGLIPVGAPGYVELPGFKYDPARARQLLADAGYPNGFSANFVGTKGIYLKDFEIEQAMQQMWRAVGVNIDLTIVENAKYLELLRQDPRKSTLEMYWNTSGTPSPGPADYYLRRFGCDFFAPVGFNSAGSCVPEIDTLAKGAQLELDTAKRDALIKSAQEQISAQALGVWLLSVTQLTGTSAKLHDPVIRNESLYVNEKTWLEE
ncbi:MAG: twin-arginine translocation signal domain-containing protein [Chloroflexi bacterium]|nr:twin-arginine translocation signal domain-containing protein [Chloroflexota bacterium]